jgi:hypothetical protein
VIDFVTDIYSTAISYEVMRESVPLFRAGPLFLTTKYLAWLAMGNPAFLLVVAASHAKYFVVKGFSKMV